MLNFRLVKADRAHHKFTLSFAVFCFFWFPLGTQGVFADDIYIYKDKNGVLTYTSAPTQAGYPRVIRSEVKPESSTRSSHAESKSTFIRLFRLKDTDEIGYWDGEKFLFIPLWPERYAQLLAGDTAFANYAEFEDIWVNGLSEQVGPIKMRRELPSAVTAAAIDWLIEQNLDKYKPRITSQSNQLRPNFFIIVFVILIASLPILFFKDRYKNLATILFLAGVAMYKYAVSTRCQYCKTRTEDDSRLNDHFKTGH
jgi:hypothetical protein